MNDDQREDRAPYLPSGYRLDDESDPDFAVLRREGGSGVAVFSAAGPDPQEIERRAWEDHRERNPECGLFFSSRTMKSEGPRKRDHETDEHVEDPDTDTGETQQEAPAGSA